VDGRWVDDDGEPAHVQRAAADNDNDEPAAAAAVEEEGYRAFEPPQGEVKGILYKIPRVDPVLYERLRRYVQNGTQHADWRFAKEVYGLINTTGRREFGQFWESPWEDDEARQESASKRKQDEQQRSMAVRSYIRASTNTLGETGANALDEGGENLRRFLRTVDQLKKWDEGHGQRALVKTVSRVVQSYERTGLVNLLAHLNGGSGMGTHRTLVRPFLTQPPPDEETGRLHHHNATSMVACTLRRNDQTYNLFAEVVAAELVWADATSAGRNTTNHLSERLRAKCVAAYVNLIRKLGDLLQSQDEEELQPDRHGMPLMDMNRSMIIAQHGILCVVPGTADATYILDVEGRAENVDFSQIRRIKVLRVVDHA